MFVARSSDAPLCRWVITHDGQFVSRVEFLKAPADDKHRLRANQAAHVNLHGLFVWYRIT